MVGWLTPGIDGTPEPVPAFDSISESDLSPWFPSSVSKGDSVLMATLPKLRNRNCSLPGSAFTRNMVRPLQRNGSDVLSGSSGEPSRHRTPNYGDTGNELSNDPVSNAVSSSRCAAHFAILRGNWYRYSGVTSAGCIRPMTILYLLWGSALSNDLEFGQRSDTSLAIEAFRTVGFPLKEMVNRDET
ncbi:MAG: hypothetical protein BWX47_00441 [candidate division Hyd24-12 bacterium ADurb.Bin004]|nr:MAG: hypothetical protein BWX47_00441 [candidate division Hyd24-12 bacterium ADurb.Bin004]